LKGHGCFKNPYRYQFIDLYINHWKGMDVFKTRLIINLFLNHPSTPKSVEKRNQNNNGYAVWYSKNFLHPFVIIESQKGKEKGISIGKNNPYIFIFFNFFKKKIPNHLFIIQSL
jgi:hypothetical protein